jgi:uncharacterized protein YjbJ (UPF0337 family)
MTKDIFERQWNPISGQLDARGDKFTYTDLEQAEGKSVQLIGLLQELYGCNRERAEAEFKRRLKQIDAYWPSSPIAAG